MSARNPHKKAFTLIELLVVVAIISMMASIILSSLNQARSKSRDARRVADIKQLQLALSLYYNDNGSYPSSLTSGLAPNYISVVPNDPGPAAGRTYTYSAPSGASTYTLYATLENPDPSLTSSPSCAPAAGTTNYYCVAP